MDPAAALDRWLGAYKRAWEDRDPVAAADLFAADATYHETPFDEPSRGRDGIFEYWSDVPRTQRGISFSYEILATTENGGVAHWRASFHPQPPGPESAGHRSERRPRRHASRSATRS